MLNDRVAEIANHFGEVTHRIARAAAASGRSPDNVRLLVVTKAQPLEVVEAVIQAGARDLAENYPDESVEKITDLHARYPEVRWHMIGHLQSRKSRLVVDHFNWLHSLDSLSLAEKLDRVLTEADRTLPVLLEFNVGEEESKFGWPAWDEKTWDGLLSKIQPLFNCTHLQICGLMTMPPYSDNPESGREYFARLKRLQEFFQSKLPQSTWAELSMGTSTDFEIAVSEGATMVRVGQAIVGLRPPKSILQR